MQKLSRLVVAVALVSGALSACGDDDDDVQSPMTVNEVVNTGGECFRAEEQAGSAGIPDKLITADRRECLERLAADPLGRLYLLGVGDSDLAREINGMVSFFGPQARFGLETFRNKAQAPGESEFEDLAIHFEELIGLLNADEDPQRGTAAEVAGVLSFLPVVTARQASKQNATLTDYASSLVKDSGLEPTKAAVATAEEALAERWQNDFVRLVTSAIADAFAVALWAEPQVREALLAAGASPPPDTTVAGAAISPPLVDQSGVLRFPEAKETGTKAAFDAWYEEGGGKLLHELALTFPDKVVIETQPDHNSPMVPALFSGLLPGGSE